MDQITTFVIYDLETTGLPKYNETTKITELAMKAISRDNLLAASSTPTLLPRISHQLTFCINPNKAMDPVAARITGLTNNMLQHEQVFDDDLFLSVKHFLARLPPPICLVAHNGNTFDHPILKAELNSINQKLPESLLCTDSLIAFRSMFARGSSPPPQHNGNGPAKKKPKTAACLKNHTLVELFKFLVSVHSPNAHEALADVEMLVKCVVSHADQFVKWADVNATLFSNVKEMWDTARIHSTGLVLARKPLAVRVTQPVVQKLMLQPVVQNPVVQNPVVQNPVVQKLVLQPVVQKPVPQLVVQNSVPQPVLPDIITVCICESVSCAECNKTDNVVEIELEYTV